MLGRFHGPECDARRENWANSHTHHVSYKSPLHRAIRRLNYPFRFRDGDQTGQRHDGQATVVSQSDDNFRAAFEPSSQRHRCRQAQTERIPPFADRRHLLIQFVDDSQ